MPCRKAIELSLFLSRANHKPIGAHVCTRKPQTYWRAHRHAQTLGVHTSSPMFVRSNVCARDFLQLAAAAAAVAAEIASLLAHRSRPFLPIRASATPPPPPPSASIQYLSPIGAFAGLKSVAVLYADLVSVGQWYLEPIHWHK